MVSKIQFVMIFILAILIGFTGYMFYMLKTFPKVGVVDNAVLLSQFSEAISARQQLEQEKRKWENNVKSLEDSVKNAFEVIKQNYDKASEQKRIEMQKNLQRWNEEFNRYTKAVETMSQQKENELLKPVLERLNSFVKIWAKRNNYPVIIGTGNGGVILSCADRVNVTDQIIEALNKYYGSNPNNIPDESQKCDNDSIKTKLTNKKAK